MWNNTTKVHEVMTSPAITVRPDTSSAQVIDILLSNDINSVPVVDEDCRLVGIVSESDLVLSAAYGKDNRRALALVAEVIQGRPAGWVDRVNAKTAASLMTPVVTTVAPDDDIAEASRRMLRRRCSRLPVIEGGKVVGVLSRHDVMRALFPQSEGAGHGPVGVPPTASSVEVLTTEACMALLGVTHVGRLAFLSGDHPMILPVNYDIDDGRIVFRTDPGEKLTEVPMRRVAFEIDGLEDAEAWSVTAQGHAREVTTALGAAYNDLRAMEIPLCAPGIKQHWIAIEVTRLTGRRFR